MSRHCGWSVRHPGIGVLRYDSEAEARIAAGTAGEVLSPDELWERQCRRPIVDRLMGMGEER